MYEDTVDHFHKFDFILDEMSQGIQHVVDKYEYQLIISGGKV